MRWLLLFLSLLASPAHADDMTLIGVGQQPKAAGAAGYTGPIDVVASPNGFYSLRAGSAAIATAGTQKLVNIRRVTDSVACDVLVATSGDLGLTSPTCNGSTQGGLSTTAFAGTDASATGAIAATALTMTATLHVGDQITGAGVTAGTYVVSGSSPNWVVNQSQTVASETLTATVGLTVVTIYDQSGNANDLTQATGSTQPVFLVNAINTTKPVLACNGTRYLAKASVTSTAQPLSTTGVAIRTGGTGGFTEIGASSTSNTMQFGGSNSANTWYIFSNSIVTRTVTDNAWHAAQGVFNGASSVLNVDGSETSGNVSNLGALANMGLCAFASGSGIWVGNVTEFGWWPVGFSSGNRSSLRSNQSAYWGTP